jgi:hypothetical protein
MSKIIISILKAITTIVVYALGIYLILIYLETDHTSDTIRKTGAIADQGAGGGAGIAILGFLVLVIWTAIWYAIVYKLKAIYVKEKNILDLRLIYYVLKIPVFSLLLILLYAFAIYPLYYYVNRKIILNRQENLLEYLKNGQTEKALEIIQNKKIENYHYSNGTSLLYNASLYDQTIFDTLLNRFDLYNKNLTTNYSQTGGCLFCNLKSEETALNAIEKIDFDTKYWESSHSKAAFCDNKDLLIFFIERKWHKCIEKYLEKCSAPKQRGYQPDEVKKSDNYKLYNCQIKFYDVKMKLYNLKSVDPYQYSPDSLTKNVLDQYEFQK